MTSIDTPLPVAIPIYKGNTSPGIEDVIRIGGDLYDLTGQTITFNMREEDSEDVAVSGTATADPDQVNNKGRVIYVWSAGQTDIPGEYRFWWNVQTPQGPQDTIEYPLVILDHAPGWDKRTGAIAERLSFQLPGTVPAMRSEPTFGDEGIQTLVDTVKARLFGTIIPARFEYTTYSARVLDYVAKVCAIKLIPAAIDYWGDRTLNVTIHGNTSETSTYPDKREHLWKLLKQLKLEVGKGKLCLQEDGTWDICPQTYDRGFPTTRAQPWVTPDPAAFPKLFYTLNGNLPWVTAW